MTILDPKLSSLLTTRLLYEMAGRHGIDRAERAERHQRLTKAQASRLPPSRLEDLGIDLVDLL